MLCPYCTTGETRVIDSRENEHSLTVRRRRECSGCDKRFTTYERCEMELTVIKRDGRKETFDRDKMKMGMVRACAKRPISVETIDHLTTKLESKLRSMGGEVKSEAIGKLIMHELKKLDKIAYIRFASVYHDFDDVQSFEKEAKLLTH
ncbi:MAG: transcriptional regulator NrdR [Nanoarchaeota archaeon]